MPRGKKKKATRAQLRHDAQRFQEKANTVNTAVVPVQFTLAGTVATSVAVYGTNAVPVTKWADFANRATHVTWAAASGGGVGTFIATLFISIAIEHYIKSKIKAGYTEESLNHIDPTNPDFRGFVSINAPRLAKITLQTLLAGFPSFYVLNMLSAAAGVLISNITDNNIMQTVAGATVNTPIAFAIGGLFFGLAKVASKVLGIEPLPARIAFQAIGGFIAQGTMQNVLNLMPTLSINPYLPPLVSGVGAAIPTIGYVTQMRRDQAQQARLNATDEVADLEAQKHNEGLVNGEEKPLIPKPNKSVCRCTIL